MKNIDKLELGSGARPSDGYLHSDVTMQKTSILIIIVIHGK